MNTDKREHESEILIHDPGNQESIYQFLLRILFEHPAGIAFFVLAVALLSMLGSLFTSTPVSRILIAILFLVVIFSFVSLLQSISKRIKSKETEIYILRTQIEILSKMMANQAETMKSIQAIMSSRFRVSLSHPKLLSKRHSTHFRVRIYPSAMRHIVRVHLELEKSEKDTVEKEFSSNITVGEIVEVKLFSPLIDFSPPVPKRITRDINLCSFTGIPKEDCTPDTHAAILTISQKETGLEIMNIPFELKVVDFVFDHISRPFVSNLVSAILGAGSIVTYILTLLGQIDTVLGVTSGTTAVIIAAILQIRVFSLYKNMSQTVEHP